MHSKLTSFRVALAVALSALLTYGCRDRQQTATAGDHASKPLIYTTFYPTLFFAKTIGGEAVNVTNPCPSDADAIFWMPSAEVVADYQRADMIIINGAGFERWIEKASLPESRLVDSSRLLQSTLIRYSGAVSHSHGPSGTHTHEGVDGHTWLDPVNALVQATAIKAAMDAAFPELRETFAKGFPELETQLRALDHELRDLTENCKVVTVACSHPAYNYIGRRYGWHLVNLDLDPERALTSEQLTRLKESLATNRVACLLWESQPVAPLLAQIERDLGLQSAVFSPCELIHAQDLAKGVNYVNIMKRNIENMKRVLTESESPSNRP